MNSIEINPVGNSISINALKNSVDVSLFSVTSEYFLLTQFQSYRHDKKVGDADVDNH